MKKTKTLGLGMMMIILSGITMAGPIASQLSHDVEISTKWTNTYVNQSSVLHYVIDYFNKGTNPVSNVTISTSLPSYLGYLVSSREDISTPISTKTYGNDDPCRIDLVNETGVYMGLLEDFAHNNNSPSFYDLLLTNPDTLSFLNAPYNGAANMAGDYFNDIIHNDAGDNVQGIFYNMTNVDIKQAYPQCGLMKVTSQERNIGSLASGVGGQINLYLQILGNQLYSNIADYGVALVDQDINYNLGADSLSGGPIYSTYTNKSNTGTTTVFLTKTGVPQLFSDQDILNAVIHDGMTDKEKAIAIWQFVKDYTLNFPDPNSQQRYSSTLWVTDTDSSDPVRMLNTLYGMCGEINSTFVSLAKMAGLTGRINGLEGHIPAEILIDGNRAYMDADGGAYWTDPNDGHIYSMAELEANPSIITNNPQDLNYEPAYYASLLASTGDNTTGSEYASVPGSTPSSHTMAFQLYPHDIISYGTYDLQQEDKYFGEGTIKRTLGPDANIDNFMPDSFSFHESLPYLIINTYIESDGSIPDDVSVYLKKGTGNLEPEIPLGYLHKRLAYKINTPDRPKSYYDYTLRFKCQSGCNTADVISHITVTSSFTYNSLVLSHQGSVDLHILDTGENFAGIDIKTEYNTNNKISLSTTASLDENDDIPLNNEQTLTLDALGNDRIILPVSGSFLGNVLFDRGFISNNGGSFFSATGRLVHGADLDFYNTFTIADNIIFSSTDANVQIYLPKGLVLTPSKACHDGSGGLDKPGQMSPGSASEEFAGANWITNDLATVISVSDQCEDVSLNLSEPVKIRIYVSQTLGSNVFAKASRDGGETRETIAATRISDHMVEIETTHFSLFTVSSNNSNTTPSGGGGGGGGVVAKDNCPNGDFSSSYYDGICGTHATTTTTGTYNTNTILSGNIISTSCDVSDELIGAYDLAYKLGMTSSTDVCKANMYGPMVRKYLAKFLSIYAIKTLNMKPDTTKTCVFTDISNESRETQFYIKMACQLGLMGLEQDGTPAKVFNPNESVNRAQFGTVFSRLMFGSKYNIAMTDTRPWYTDHLNILKKTSIMEKIDDPSMIELRGYVMLMMMKMKTLLKK